VITIIVLYEYDEWNTINIINLSNTNTQSLIYYIEVKLINNCCNYITYKLYDFGQSVSFPNEVLIDIKNTTKIKGELININDNNDNNNDNNDNNGNWFELDCNYVKYKFKFDGKYVKYKWSNDKCNNIWFLSR